MVALGIVGVLIIFLTLPAKSTASGPVVPTVDLNQKLGGENLPGQILFARSGSIWVWKDGQGVRLAIEAGASVIANQTASLLQPALSPASNAIAYIRRDETFSDLWVVNADGSNNRALTKNRSPGTPRSQAFTEGSQWAFSPAWSPDGSQLAFLADNQTDDLSLWLIAVGGGQPRRLSNVGVGAGGADHPVWSPDGKNILVAAYENGRSQVFRVNVANGAVTKLTNAEEGAYDPAYSPDGSYIAYVTRTGKASELSLMKADGTNPIVLARETSRTPTWYPGGDRVAFLALKGGAFELMAVDVKGGQPSNVRQISTTAKLDGTSGLFWGK